MCVLYLALNVHPEFPLVVAANRDEYWNRPTLPAGFWEEAPQILAGKDLLANGTWAGVTLDGRYGFLTNIRSPGETRANTPSRGKIVVDYLRSKQSPVEFLETIRKEGLSYNPFNLLVGTQAEFWYTNHRGDVPRLLGPGVHGLSNGFIDEDWPKVREGKKRIPQILAGRDISSLRSIDLETTTTGESDSLEQKGINAAWHQIDSSPLSEIRFGRSHIAQIAKSGRLTSEELQESIYAFSFDLAENQKIKSITGAPLNYFMGILRKGPYVAPANYEAPEDRQRRLYLEAKEKHRKNRQELEERHEAIEFEEWAEKITLEQRAALVPPKDFAKPGSTAHNYQMREYFRENVWPQLKEKVLRAQGDSNAI